MVSIVIPTLNEEKNLSNLLISLEKQTYKNFEVIVADARSKDKTVEIAKNFGAKVVKGGMPSVGRNAGAAVAKGDLIFFFDADVVLEPNFLKKTLRNFRERKLSVATCFFVPLSEKRIDKFLHQMVNYYYQATQKFLPHAAGFCILVRKEIHRKIGGFDERIVLAEDLDYVRRAAKLGKFGVLKDPKIYVSVRRLERDGRLTIAMKYALAEMYMNLLGGIKTNIFNYNFAHYDEEKKEKFRARLKTMFLSVAKRRVSLPRAELIRIYYQLVNSFRNRL